MNIVCNYVVVLLILSVLAVGIHGGKTAAEIKAQRKKDHRETENALAGSRVSGYARIASTIVLHNNLIDGSAPIDEVIPEVLQLGTLKLKDLENYSHQKVVDYGNALKAARRSLKDESAIIEDEFLNVDFLSELLADMDSFDFSELLDQQSFNQLDVISTWNLADLFTTDTQTFAHSIDVEEPLIDDPVEMKKSYLDPFHKHFMEFKRQVGDVSGLQEVLQKLNSPKLNTFSDAMLHYKQTKLVQVVGQDQKSKNAMMENFKLMETLRVEAENELNIIDRIIASNVVHYDFERKHTTGHEITRLSNFDEFLNETGVIRPFFKSYVPLKNRVKFDQLDDHIWLIDRIFGNATGIYDHGYGVKKLQRLLKSAKKQFAGLEDVDKAVAAIKKCSLVTTNSNLPEKLLEMRKLSSTLLLKVNAVGRILSRFTDDVLKTFDLTKDKKNLKELGKQFAGFGYDKKQIQGEQNTPAEQPDSVYRSLKSSYQEVLKLKSDGAIYKPYFECVKSINVKKVAESVAILKDLRLHDVRVKIASDVETTSGWVAKAIPVLGDLKRDLIKLKENITKIEGLDGLKKYSKSFGDAIGVINKIGDVDRRSPDMGHYIGRNSVEQTLPRATVRQQYHYRKVFGDPATEDAIMRKLLEQAKERFANWPETHENSTLKEYGKIFPNFAGVDDVSWNIEERYIAMVDYGIMGGVWEKFLGFQLNFSKYEKTLKEMPEILVKMEKIFSGETEEEKEAEALVNKVLESDYLWLYILIAVVVLLLIIGAIILTVCLCKRKKNKGGANDKKKPSGKPAPGNKNQGTSSKPATGATTSSASNEGPRNI